MTDTKHTDSLEECPFHSGAYFLDCRCNHTDSVEAKMSIEEMVEKLAACRYTGNPKTYPSEENYKANLTIVLAQCLQATTSQQVEEAVRKSQPSLLTVGYHNGEMDFGVNCSIDELTYEQMRDFREMVCVAIGQAEQMWRKRWTGKEPCAGTLTPNHQD